MHMEKKKTVYFCIVHVSIVSIHKATTPEPHATAQAYDFVLLSSHPECIRKILFLTIFALVAAWLAGAMCSMGRCEDLLRFESVTILWKGRLPRVDNSG